MTSTEEMAKWKKMTAGMGALSVAVTALVLATEEHHHPDPDAPVVRIRQQYDATQQCSSTGTLL